jgi:hypothetical protein
VEAVVLATRLLVAISAQSVAAVDDVVTLPQLRRALVPVLRSFAVAAGEVPAEATWSLGWTTAG